MCLGAKHEDSDRDRLAYSEIQEYLTRQDMRLGLSEIPNCTNSFRRTPMSDDISIPKLGTNKTTVTESFRPCLEPLFRSYVRDRRPALPVLETRFLD